MGKMKKKKQNVREIIYISIYFFTTSYRTAPTTLHRTNSVCISLRYNKTPKSQYLNSHAITRKKIVSINK